MRPSRTPKHNRSRLKPPSFYQGSASPLYNLLQLENMLGRAGFKVDNLSPYQRDIHHCLVETINRPTHHIAGTILEFGAVDWSAVPATRGYVPKPRISIDCRLTSKGNLSMTWLPGHLDLTFHEKANEEWLQIRNTTGGFERPENELVFIREAECLKTIESNNKPISIWVDCALLGAIQSVMNWTIKLLELRFDIQRHSYLHCKEAPPETFGFLNDGFSLGGGPTVPTGFSIEHTIADERKRIEGVIDQMQSMHSIDAGKLWEQLKDYRYDHGGLHAERASKSLRKAGFETLKPSILRKLEADLLKAIEAKLWSPPGRVVPLRPVAPG